MGGFCGGAKSASQGFSSNAKDPAVAKTGKQYPAKVTYNAKGNTSGTSPKPPKKPSAFEKKVYDVTGSFARDLNMGLSTFGQSKEKQTATLQAAGYSDDVIKDYQERTAASRERMRKQMASSNDNDNDNLPSPVRNAITSMVGAAPSAPAPTTPTPPPAPAPISEDTSAPEEGSAEAKVLAEAGVEADGTPTGRGRRGRRSTIETTPQGLITKAKTTKKKSLMNKMIT